MTAGFYGSHTFNLSASAQNTLNAQNLADGPDYTKTVANPGGNNIVDYTPRMISRTITTGSDGNDVIHGEDGGDLIDGGAGDDELFGESSQSSATGVDQIIGGAGNDTIHGAAGIDKLDFSGIDAKVGGFGNGGDQGFTSLLQTTDAFTAAGQLHYHCENIGLANEITVV